MSTMPKQSPDLESIASPCESGQTKVSSTPLELQVNECTMSTSSSPITLYPEKKPRKKYQKKEKSVTAESLLTGKKMISSDKLTSSNLNSQNMTLSPTSDPESTSNAKVLKPFWNSHSKIVSEKLWSRIETVSADSGLISLNGLSKNMVQKSWFSTTTTEALKKNLPRISFPSSMYSPAELTESENMLPKQTPTQSTTPLQENEPDNLKPEVPLITRMIRLYPRKKDRKTIKTWMDDARATYNLCLSAINDKEFGTKAKDFGDLKKKFVTKVGLTGTENEYLLRTPAHIRADSVRDLKQAFSTNFAKKRTNPKHNFKVQFRSNMDSQSIHIQSGDYVAKGSKNESKILFPSFIQSSIGTSPKLPEDFRHHDSRLIKNKLGEFYLAVLVKAPSHPPKLIFEEPTTDVPSEGVSVESQIDSEDISSESLVDSEKTSSESVISGESEPQSKLNIISLDPGVRTFLTGFCPNNQDYQFIEYGKGDVAKLVRLSHHVNKMIGMKAKELRKNKRKNLKRAIARLRLRIQRLRQDCHHRIVNHLVTNFDTVVIPAFNTKDMVKKENRKIGKITVKSMLLWSHFSLRQRLLEKAKQTHTTIIVTTEEYTSKTCSKCGIIDPKLGGSKTFKCKHCKWRIDRDFNGSVNILNKYLTKLDLNQVKTRVSQSAAGSTPYPQLCSLEPLVAMVAQV